MTVFIELELDPFVEIGENENTQVVGTEIQPVRRPLRGIQIKPDSYAYFKVVDKYGKAIPVMDAGGEDDPENPGKGRSVYYTNFLVQAVNQASTEKYQIVPTFGDPYVFFYGQNPMSYTIAGKLMNTYDFTWANEFWYNYETYLRGSKCVENGAKIYFYCDGQLWEGYLLNCHAVRNAVNRNVVDFSVTMLVVREYIVENIGDTDFPIYPEGNRPEGKSTFWDRIFGRISSVLSTIETVAATTAATAATAYGLWNSMRSGDATSFAANVSAALDIGVSFFGRGSTPAVYRGKIRDNWDEYIGARAPSFNTPWYLKVKLGLNLSAAAFNMVSSLEAEGIIGVGQPVNSSLMHVVHNTNAFVTGIASYT